MVQWIFVVVIISDIFLHSIESMFDIKLCKQEKGLKSKMLK